MNKVTELKYGNTRCYCIDGKLLIDTDWAGTLPGFFRCAKENGIELSKIEYLIITHFHPDHMGIAQDLADLGIKLVIFDVQREYTHFSDNIFAKENKPFKPIDDENALYLSCEESRQFLSMLGIDGEALHTVGHSEDSVSVILDDGAAIVGDLYPLYSVPAYNDTRLEQSWDSILSRGVRHIYYAHAKEDVLENVTSIKEILSSHNN